MEGPRTYENPRTAAKMKWYNRVKTDPEQAAKFKEQRKRYYQEHAEEERAKALARYYKRKLAATTVASDTPAPIVE